MITCTFENGNIASPGVRHITVGVILIKENQVLLGLRANVPGKNMLEAGKWGLLGGFMDRDETLVECARRKVMEESGWTIDDLQLFRINDSPTRPMEDRQNVDFIFIAKAKERVGTPDEEVKELKWFPINELPNDDEIAFDHEVSLHLFAEHLDNPQTLPLTLT